MTVKERETEKEKKESREVEREARVKTSEEVNKRIYVRDGQT